MSFTAETSPFHTISNRLWKNYHVPWWTVSTKSIVWSKMREELMHHLPLPLLSGYLKSIGVAILSFPPLPGEILQPPKKSSLLISMDILRNKSYTYFTWLSWIASMWLSCNFSYTSYHLQHNHTAHRAGHECKLDLVEQPSKVCIRSLPLIGSCSTK